MPAPRLTLAHAQRRFGARIALHPLSLDIEPGTLVAIAGPSGSGKSTLLAMLMGALVASAGSVCVDDHDLAGMSARALRRYRRGIGVLQQEALVVAQLSVHGNVLAGLVPSWPWYRVLASAMWPLERQRVFALLERLGLGDRQWDPAATLSGGQKQRVALARALIGDPGLICADEPTAALDPRTAADVIAVIAGEARARGASLLLCTHQLSQVIEHVDRVLGLRDGRVVLDCPPAGLSNQALGMLYRGSNEQA